MDKKEEQEVKDKLKEIVQQTIWSMAFQVMELMEKSGDKEGSSNIFRAFQETQSYEEYLTILRSKK